MQVESLAIISPRVRMNKQRVVLAMLVHRLIRATFIRIQQKQVPGPRKRDHVINH